MMRDTDVQFCSIQLDEGYTQANHRLSLQAGIVHVYHILHSCGDLHGSLHKQNPLIEYR